MAKSGRAGGEQRRGRDAHAETGRLTAGERTRQCRTKQKSRGGRQGQGHAGPRRAAVVRFLSCGGGGHGRGRGCGAMAWRYQSQRTHAHTKPPQHLVVTLCLSWKPADLLNARTKLCQDRVPLSQADRNIRALCVRPSRGWPFRIHRATTSRPNSGTERSCSFFLHSGPRAGATPFCLFVRVRRGRIEPLARARGAGRGRPRLRGRPPGSTPAGLRASGSEAKKAV